VENLGQGRPTGHRFECRRQFAGRQLEMTMTVETLPLSHPLRLGALELKHNTILSPMVGVTDAPFRRLCAQGGAALLCGEMLSAQAINHENKKTLKLLEF